MAEKRFTLQESDIYNRNDVIHDKGIEMPQSTVCDLLNEQDAEIKRLKNELAHYKVMFNSLQDRYSGLLKIFHGCEE